MSLPASDVVAGSVLFRCDAGPQYGVGHVMRCVALAEEFAARGHAIVFVADLDSVPWARAQVEGRGFEHRQPDDPGDPQAEVAALVADRPWFVVIDSYTLQEAVYVGVRAAGVSTLAIVDGDPTGRPADLWLDQNIGAEADPWTIPAGTSRLAGLDFALMRSDVRAARPTGPERSEADPLAVFAFFGGTDALGAAPVVLAALLDTRVALRVRVVAATDELARACSALVAGPGQVVEVIAPTETLPAEVRAADVVLSAAGTSSWELLCLGAATGLVCVAANQETSYRRAVEADLVAGLGYLDELRLDPRPAQTDGLVALLGSAQRRRTLRLAAWKAVDGQGRARVVEACAAVGPTPI